MNTKKTAYKNILIVDDEAEIRQILSSYLSKRHFNVHEAGNGAEALEAVRKKRPDLIILDVAMPVMDGFELLKKIKKDPRYSRIPVIMLTIKTDPEDLAEGISLKADFYLPKPFRLENVMKFIRLILTE